MNALGTAQTARKHFGMKTQLYLLALMEFAVTRFIHVMYTLKTKEKNYVLVRKRTTMRLSSAGRNMHQC
jgi:hypothetical protein